MDGGRDDGGVVARDDGTKRARADGGDGERSHEADGVSNDGQKKCALTMGTAEATTVK